MQAVIDSSVMVEFVTGSRAGRAFADRYVTEGVAGQLADLCLIEVAAALKSLERGRLLTTHDARNALSYLIQTPFPHHQTEQLLPDIWKLRHNLSLFDAAHAALAQHLGCQLWTRDIRIARALPERTVLLS